LTFKKNLWRETTLLGYWNLGYTVKDTALITGIPAGSISHYFARFNKNPLLYREKAGTQDPPRTSTPDLVNASILYSNVNTKVAQFIKNEEFEKARDLLLTVLLQMEFAKRVTPFIKNADPNKLDEFIMETAKIYVAYSQMQKMKGQ